MSITTNYDLVEATARNNIPLVGVFYKNKLPQQVYQGGYIFNLADNDEDGTHWTSAWVEKENGKLKVVYWDSFGVAPPENIKHYFSKIDPSVPYSKKQVQNIVSSICGYYVLFFLYFMSHRQGSVMSKLKKFETLWSLNPEENRRLLEEYLKPLE